MFGCGAQAVERLGGASLPQRCGQRLVEQVECRVTRAVRLAQLAAKLCQLQSQLVFQVNRGWRRLGCGDRVGGCLCACSGLWRAVCSRQVELHHHGAFGGRYGAGGCCTAGLRTN
ncbi:hypothetical protein D3C72_1080600 [compost metagenome]